MCEIMGIRVPEEAISQFAHRYGFYQLGSSASREIGAGMRRGLDRGRGTGRGGGMGRGFGRDRRRSRR